MKSRVGPAVALFFLAPLVAEFLLGNLPVTYLGALVLLAPMYGGGALLIREAARRFGLAWPGIVILGLAYGVIEEGLVDQSLFNPHYLGLHLLNYGYIPMLGMGSWWTVFVLSLHMIWSTSVPIALVETLTPDRRRTPWLGPFGIGLTAVLFVAGCALLTRFQLKSGFAASRSQLLGSAAAVLVLIAVAFAIGRREAAAAPAASQRRPPPPLFMVLVALSVGALFNLLVRHPAVPASLDVAAIIVLLVAGAINCIAWSRRPGWNERHRLALAAGFLLTYAWSAFLQAPSVGHTSIGVVRLGNAVFAAGALAILAAAMRCVGDPDSSQISPASRKL